MDDNLSEKSTDSISNSDEYVFINNSQISHSSSGEQPKLDIANNGDLNDLCMDLKEVLNEGEISQGPLKIESSIVEVGNSKFYSSKERSYGKNLVFEDVQQECTIFNGVSYLGSAAIKAPKSEPEIQQNITILNEQSSENAIRISISIPNSSEGSVVLYDSLSQQVMTRYEIQSIVFYARGKANSKECSCFAFTWSHGESHETSIFQCHVFKCDIPEAVGQVSQCFAKAFQHPSTKMSNSESPGVEMYIFEVTLEIKEDNGKGYVTVPRDRNTFKIRADLEKMLCLTVQQVSCNDRTLEVERCFGVLVSPGHSVKDHDMQLLETVNMGSGNSEKQMCVISGQWDPTETAFASLNTESLLRSYITIAMDLVIKGIKEPVRFLIETCVKVYPKNEKFWFLSSSRLVQQFYLQLGEKGSDAYEVISIETSGPLDRSRLNLALNLTSFIRSPSITSIETITPHDQHSDNDEPLLSGTGDVSKHCSTEELEGWADVWGKWGSDEMRPKQLKSLVRGGIPDALRGEVWQRLAGCNQGETLMDKYPKLLTEECSCENVIQRDINRTFPAHDFFKEAGGLGQDSLYRLIKAYAVYDKEVGYCQGLSFVAASLLLHMPEEQAFCVLVQMMYKYELRDLYKDGFDSLYMRLYQLNRLMEENLPELWQHLTQNNVESHMFASQWFLTVFTARFPLYLVFRIMDIFLLQGNDTLFQVALALLMICEKELLQLDFENILKYFRVTLPKRFLSKEKSQQLIKVACCLKMKKLKKFEHEFRALKEAQETADNFSNELDLMKISLDRSEEEKQRLESELIQVKGMLKREVDRAEVDARRNNNIIADYKKINARLDAEQNQAKSKLLDLRNKISTCENCRKYLQEVNITDSDVKLQETTIAYESEDNGKDSQLRRAFDRIRELELELAQTKLERVEAECWKQELSHRLNATLAELQTANKTSWLHKTFSTIKEVAANKTQDSNNPTHSTNDTTISVEGGELMKKVFATRKASKEKECSKESPRRSQTLDTMSSLAMTNSKH